MIHDPLPVETYQGHCRAVAPCSCGQRFRAEGSTRAEAMDLATAKRSEHLKGERAKEEEAGDG